MQKYDSRFRVGFEFFDVMNFKTGGNLFKVQTFNVPLNFPEILIMVTESLTQ